MQKVAAYRLERHDGMNWPEVRREEALAIKALVNGWLREKGASTGDAGSFDPEDDGNGSFKILTAEDGDRSWWMVRLDETSPDGRHVTTSLSVTVLDSMVAVYVTLEAGTKQGGFAPVDIGVYCPKIVRTLIEARSPWRHGHSVFRPLLRIDGFEQGEGLAHDLADPRRTVPYVVVTKCVDGTVALPYLDEKLAYDLAGIANVVVIDAAATWALTDVLGREFACFDGAIRIYWPGLTSSEDPFRHQRWLAGRLRGFGDDPKITRERFRAQVRALVMRAAALGVVRPQEIDGIRSAAARRAYAAMKAHATSLEDYQKLAEAYADENELLRKRVEDLNAQLAVAQQRVLEVEERQASLAARAEKAEKRLQHHGAPDDQIAPANAAEVEDASPQPGDVRFYKKKFSRGKQDVLVRVADCGCNNWESGHKGDKAKKGIAKLEGSNDWKAVYHCASCTGGGMWKVAW